MLMLDRRTLLRAGSAATGAVALAATTTVPALAHAPQAGKQAQPSFYRFKLGTIEITVVSDGSVAFPAARSGRGRRRPSHIDVPAAEPGAAAAQHNPRQYRRQAGVDRHRLRRRQVPENGRPIDWPPRRCGLRAERYRHDPAHSRPLRPPVGHQ